MGLASQRVAPPLERQGRTSIGLLLGITLGLVGTLVLRLTADGPLQDGRAGLVAFVLIPYFVVMLGHCLVNQQWSKLLWTALWFAVGFTIVACVMDALVVESGGTSMGPRGDWAVHWLFSGLFAVGFVPIVMLVAVAAAALARAIVRTFFVCMVAPKPGICAQCGYPIPTEARIVACPECGLGRGDTSQPDGVVASWWCWCQRRSRGMLTAAFGVFGIWVAVRVLRVVLPLMAFDNSLSANRPNAVMTIAYIGVGTVAESPDNEYAVWCHPGTPGQPGLAYAYKANPRLSAAVMRIAVCVSDPYSVDIGNPPIYVDLDRVQAQAVIRQHGASDALRGALLRRAAEANWVASGTPTFGRASYVWPSGTPLDATPYLTADPR